MFLSDVVSASGSNHLNSEKIVLLPLIDCAAGLCELTIHQGAFTLGRFRFALAGMTFACQRQRVKDQARHGFIGISSIHLLRTFIYAGGVGHSDAQYTETGIMWQTIIHGLVGDWDRFRGEAQPNGGCQE